MTRPDGPSAILSSKPLLVVALLLITAGSTHAQTSLRQAPGMDERPEEESWLDQGPQGPAAGEERTDGHAWYLLGRSFHNAGEYEAAVASWKRAEALGFALPITRYNIAAALARLGEVDPAFEWLDSALDAGFSEVDLLIVDDDLSELRGDARFVQAVLRAYENAEPCPDAEGRKEIERWTARPDAPENRAFRFASRRPGPEGCRRATGRAGTPGCMSLPALE